MKRTRSEGLVIIRFIFLFSVSLSWDIWHHPPLTTFFYPDVSFKALFVSPRLHWCVDYCHSLLLKGRVCNRWSPWSRPTVAASAGWASWQCCWPWNEEDTFRLVKRLFFFLTDTSWVKWASLRGRASSLLASELIFCFLLELVFFMVYTSQRRSDSPLPPFRH